MLPKYSAMIPLIVTELFQQAEMCCISILYTSRLRCRLSFGPTNEGKSVSAHSRRPRGRGTSVSTPQRFGRRWRVGRECRAVSQRRSLAASNPQQANDCRCGAMTADVSCLGRLTSRSQRRSWRLTEIGRCRALKNEPISGAVTPACPGGLVSIVRSELRIILKRLELRSLTCAEACISAIFARRGAGKKALDEWPH